MKFALRFICVDIGCIGIIILFKISFYKFWLKTCKGMFINVPLPKELPSWIVGKELGLLIGSCDQGTIPPPGDKVHSTIQCQKLVLNVPKQNH